MSFLFIPLIVWLVTSGATLLLGWPIVRFLTPWLSIPLMVVIAGAMSAVALFMIVMGVPGDTKKIKQIDTWYSIMLGVAFLSPMVIAFKLYDWVG